MYLLHGLHLLNRLLLSLLKFRLLFDGSTALGQDLLVRQLVGAHFGIRVVLIQLEGSQILLNILGFSVFGHMRRDNMQLRGHNL